MGVESLFELDEPVTFDQKLEYWFSAFKDTLPVGFKSRNLDAVEANNETAILKAYNCEDDDFGFLLMGKSGVGKTFVMTALMNKVLKAAHEHSFPLRDAVAYFPIGYLLFKLRGQRDPAEFDTCLKARFLFLDDLGTENTTDFAREHFFTILDLRCQRKMPTFITTNLSMNEIKEKYGERLVSRLKEMCAIIELQGSDKRADIMRDRIGTLKQRINKGV